METTMPGKAGSIDQAPCLAGVTRVRGQFQVAAVAPLHAGEAILHVRGRLTRTPTRNSVQVGADEHIDLPEGLSMEQILDDHPWRFLNHSCDPNAMFRGRTLVAIREIRAWDEITFHYNSTEYEIAEPFACQCGSLFCVGEIRGFRFLTRAARLRLEPFLAGHLRQRLTGKLERQRG
jgi:hypothetical protein